MSNGPQLSFDGVRSPLYGSSEGRWVRVADRNEVDWMIRRHYLGRWPGVVVAILGLYRPAPVGCIVFALPPAQTEIRYGGATWELARLWVSDDEPRNTETWFIARAVRYVRRFHKDVVALVSYADPSAGHAGTIYRAANWLPDGMTDDDRKTPKFDYRVNGRHFSRHSHVPKGEPWEREYRVSKHRFWLPLHKERPPARTAAAVCGVAGPR